MTLNLLDPVYQEWVNPTAINPVLGTNETVTTTTDTVTGKKGIAVITPTSVEIFDEYNTFDFILIMLINF